MGDGRASRSKWRGREERGSREHKARLGWSISIKSGSRAVMECLAAKVQCNGNCNRVSSGCA